jgi:hypothetical protein
MGKIFAVVLVIVTLVSAYPIIVNKYAMPEDISTHGHMIDDQLHETMWEAGLSFVGAQLVLAFFVWSFTNRKVGSPPEIVSRWRQGHGYRSHCAGGD